MKATTISFEKRYSDDSGVESAARLIGDAVQFERDGRTVEFFTSDLAWLQGALARIQAELDAED